MVQLHHKTYSDVKDNLYGEAQRELLKMVRNVMMNALRTGTSTGKITYDLRLAAETVAEAMDQASDEAKIKEQAERIQDGLNGSAS